jgi:hypothetical protein
MSRGCGAIVSAMAREAARIPLIGMHDATAAFTRKKCLQRKSGPRNRETSPLNATLASAQRQVVPSGFLEKDRGPAKGDIALRQWRRKINCRQTA